MRLIRNGVVIADDETPAISLPDREPVRDYSRYVAASRQLMDNEVAERDAIRGQLREERMMHGGNVRCAGFKAHTGWEAPVPTYARSRKRFGQR